MTTTKVTSDLLVHTQTGTGAVQRSVKDKLGEVVSVKDFGAVGNGSADDTAAIQAAINASTGKTVKIVGTCGITSPLEFKTGVDIVCEGSIKALSGFSGAHLVTTDSTVSYKETTITGLRLDGSGLSVKGLVVRQAQTCFINDIHVRDCLNTGIEVQGGYECFITNWFVIGKSTGMVAGSSGLKAGAGDCHYTDGVAVLYPIGVDASGGNGRFTRIHPWGVYTSGSTPMLHGFKVTGEGNTFTDCSPDSPDLADRTLAASEANGGYGFYLAGDAINTKLISCKLIVANHANAPVSKLYFCYVGKTYCGFIECNTDDNSGAAMAGQMQYLNLVTQRTTNIFGGSINTNKLWTDGMYGTFTPNLKFGATELTAGGGTYFSGRRTGYYYRIGPMIYFVIHIRVDTKGTATGDVTIDGLPFTYVDFGNSQAWPMNIQAINPIRDCHARMFVNTSTIRLYDVADGTATTDAEIGVNQEMYISGMYPVITAPV